MIIPLGMVAGAVAGLLYASLLSGGDEPRVRGPEDPGDALAMLGVFLMLAGAAVGTVVGVIVALALYLFRRQKTKYK